MAIDEVDFPGNGGVAGAFGSFLSSTNALASTGSSPNDVLERAPFSDPPSVLNSLSLPAPLSITAYSKTMSSATDLANQTELQAQQLNDVKLNGFYNNNTLTALQLVEIFQKLIQLAPQIANDSSSESNNASTLNGQINTTNSGLITNDNAQIATMNQAITDFANHTITSTQYFAAVNTYNAYVTSSARSSQAGTANSAITTYNGNTVGINSNISSVNSQLSSLGFSQLLVPQSTDSQSIGSLAILSTSTPEAGLISTESNLSLVASNLGPNVGNNIASVIAYYFSPLFNLLNPSLQNSTHQLQLKSNYQGFLQFINQTPLEAISNAYITPAPKLAAQAAQGTGGAGSGVSLTALITSLNNPLMATIIDSQKFSSDTTALSQPIDLSPSKDPFLVEKLQTLNVQTLSQLGLSAGAESAKYLIGRLPSYSVDSSPVALTVATAFSSQLLQASQTPAYKDALLKLIQNAYPNLTSTQLANLTDQIHAATNLLQLQVALTQIAAALKLPQLNSQLLATLNSTQNIALDSNNLQLSQQDILQNDASVGYLKDTLTNYAVQQGIQAESVTTAVDRAISTSITSNAQVQNQLNEQFYQQQIQTDQANQLSSLANDYLTAEATSHYQLENNISAQSLNAASLTNSLQQAGIQQGVAASSVNNTLAAANFQSNRDLRDQLSAQLVTQGVSHGAALLAATKAVVPNQPAAAPITPLSPATFNEQLNAHAVSLLTPTVSAQHAAEIANNLTTTVSQIRDRLDSNLQTLHKQENTAVDNKVDDQMRSFLKPSLSLYTFSQNLLDPARTLINTWSIMTSKTNVPAGYHKALDIAI
jgi:hypothetical protein